MKRLSPEKVQALLVELHEIIDQTSKQTAEVICGKAPLDLVYPPSDGMPELGSAEPNFLGSGMDQEEAAGIVADACASTIFSFLALLDGVSAPYVEAVEGWIGVTLCEPDLDESAEEVGELLHDEFYGQYWRWKELRGSEETDSGGTSAFSTDGMADTASSSWWDKLRRRFRG